MKFKKLEEKSNNRATFTDDMKRHLKANYHLMSLKELAEHHGLSEKQIKNQVERQYLTKRTKKY